MFTQLASILNQTNGLIGLLVLVLDIVAIVSVVAGHGSLSRKLLWTLIILVLPVLGMIIYFVFGRSSADADI